MISNQRPIDRQFSSRGFNVGYSSASLPQIESDLPGPRMFLGVCENFNYLASVLANLNNFSPNSCSHQH